MDWSVSVRLLIVANAVATIFFLIQYNKAQDRVDDFRARIEKEDSAPPSLTYRKVPFRVLSPIVRAGQAVVLEVDRCSTWPSARSYNLARTLVRVDAKAEPVILPGGTTRIEPGCLVVTSATNVVPRNTASGRYFIDGMAEVNDTHKTHFVPWRSEEFVVIAEPN